MKQCIIDIKKNMKKPLNFITTIILLLVLVLIITTMFFKIIVVTDTISSSYYTYQLQINFHWQTSYTYQCTLMYTWNGYQNVCSYVPIYQYVPYYSYVPIWSYNTTFFKSNVHLYDLIISSFGLGIKQLFFVIPILLSAWIGSFLTLANKKISRIIGCVSLGLLTIIMSGSVIAVIRLLAVNKSSSSLGIGFYLLITIMLLLLVVCLIGLFNFIKTKSYSSNRALIIKGGRNVSIIIRTCIFFLLIILSEVCIASLYGFAVYLLMIIGLIVSLSDNLICKIIGLISTAGVFIYSMVTMVILLVKAAGKHSFFTIMPVDSIIFRLLDTIIFIAIFTIIVLELKKHQKNRCVGAK